MQNSSPLFSIILLSLALSLVTAKITVVSLRSAESFNDQLAAFGNRLDGIDDGTDSQQSLTGLLVPVDAPLFQQQKQTDSSAETNTEPLMPLYWGCSALITPPSLHNKTWIGVVIRSGCSFAEKARNLQKAGASGIIVGNNEISDRLITMYGNGDLSDIVLVATFVTQSTFRELRYLASSSYYFDTTDFATIRIERTEQKSVSVVDIILISIITPLVSIVMMISLWRIRRRQLNNSLSEFGVGLDNTENEGGNDRSLLTQDDLARIRVKNYDPSSKERCECDTCAICLDDMEEGDQIRILNSCGHSFHVKCIDPWLTTRRRQCPNCKADALDTNVKLPIENDSHSHFGDEESPLIHDSSISTPLTISTAADDTHETANPTLFPTPNSENIQTYSLPNIPTEQISFSGRLHRFFSSALGLNRNNDSNQNQRTQRLSESSPNNTLAVSV